MYPLRAAALIPARRVRSVRVDGEKNEGITMKTVIYYFTGTGNTLSYCKKPGTGTES